MLCSSIIGPKVFDAPGLRRADSYCFNGQDPDRHCSTAIAYDRHRTAIAAMDITHVERSDYRFVRSRRVRRRESSVVTTRRDGPAPSSAGSRPRNRTRAVCGVRVGFMRAHGGKRRNTRPVPRGPAVIEEKSSVRRCRAADRRIGISVGFTRARADERTRRPPRGRRSEDAAERARFENVRDRKVCGRVVMTEVARAKRNQSTVEITSKPIGFKKICER